MSTKRYTQEFKVEAVGQVVEKGYRVADVAARLGDHMDAPLREHGLNSTLWTSLVVIYASEQHRLKPSDLSVFMNSSRTNSTRVARDSGRASSSERNACSAKAKWPLAM